MTDDGHGGKRLSRAVARNLISSGIAVTVAAVVFVGLLLDQHTGHVFANTEARLVDLRFRLRDTRPPAAEVVIAAIDSKSIEKLGRWPWSRRVHAALVDQLREWGASAVVFDVLFSEEEGVEELARLEAVAGALPAPGSEGDGGAMTSVRAAVERARSEAAVDRGFAASLERTLDADAALAVLAFHFAFTEDLDSKRYLGSVLGPDQERTILDLASYLSRDANAVALRTDPPALAVGVRPVVTSLAEWVPALGFANAAYDFDGALRRERVVVVYSPAIGRAYQRGIEPRQALLEPGAAVQAYMPLAVAGVATHLRLSVDQLVLDLPAGELRIDNPRYPGGRHVVRFDPSDGTMPIDYCGANGSFPTYSVVDIVDGKLTGAFGHTVDGREAFSGKLVFVGNVDQGLGDFFVTPYTARLPGVEKQATVAENLLAGRQLREHRDPILVIGLSALVAAIAVALLAGNLGAFTGALALVALLGLWLGATFHDFTSRGVVWNWTVPLLTLGLGYAAVISYRSAVERRAKRALAARSRFIQETFGRYLSDEVVKRLVASPEGLKLGGERRRITIMMSDLRGFSAICERTSPEAVVNMLNSYLGAMTEVIFKYGGTIDEFIGDAILALFGAPEARDDDALRAVACAVEMQRAMESVNHTLREEGLPEVEMGIALNTGDVVVGNIGSERRSKYGVVGTHVNLTGRIESLTLGGQILISDSTLQAVGGAVETGISHEIKAKGFAEPVPVHEVRAVGAPYNLRMPEVAVELVTLPTPLEVDYSVLEGKMIAEVVRRGALVAVSGSAADLRCEEALPALANLRLVVRRPDGDRAAHQLYAKVVERSVAPGCCALVFTSIPVELREYFEGLVTERAV